MKKVEKAAKEADNGEKVYTYGPLIHNHQVLEDLARKGVGQINAPDEIDKGTVVIRAHGIELETFKELERGGLKIVDGTCPRVLRSMRTVRQYSQEGWHIILYGDASHGEIRAVGAYASDLTIVENPEQARRVEVPDKTLVIAQTTVSLSGYREVCKILQEKNPNIEIVKSICPATKERQQALKRLAKEVEAVVVIGGKHSSNTKRLYELAVESGKPAWHIEVAEDLPAAIRNFQKIGVTAGASTPDWIIEQVEERIKTM